MKKFFVHGGNFRLFWAVRTTT